LGAALQRPAFMLKLYNFASICLMAKSSQLRQMQIYFWGIVMSDVCMGTFKVVVSIGTNGQGICSKCGQSRDLRAGTYYPVSHLKPANSKVPSQAVKKQ
jgi:hypothetical protein